MGDGLMWFCLHNWKDREDNRRRCIKCGKLQQWDMYLVVGYGSHPEARWEWTTVEETPQ